MTRIEEIIANALAGIPETDAAILAREVVRLREAPAVVVPDDTLTLDLDEFGKSLVCITINSKNRGVGYELCGTMGDGHFSRRTFDITPYLAHCLNTIGVRAIPADRVLGEGNQFGVGFVEACGMLAAKPFDRPTLAAGLIREGGMIAALAETPSDGPGISILREEMQADLDALRANQGGASA